jgi:hypothetical protein
VWGSKAHWKGWISLVITTRHLSLNLNRNLSNLSNLKQAESQVAQAQINITETNQALRVRSPLRNSEVFSKPRTRRFGISSRSNSLLRLE